MASDRTTVDAAGGTERIGAVACWGFGGAWAIWGLTGVAGGAALAIAVVPAVILAMATAGAGEAHRPRRQPADWQRRYNLLVVAELVAIFVASFALGRTGYPELIPAAICLIVGAYFWPLAGIFDLALYRWTALALCAVAIFGAALLAVTNASAVRAVVGLGAAAVLWVSAVQVSRTP